MYINTKNIEELIECFVELNEDNQKKAISTIKGLFIQQLIIKNSDYEEDPRWSEGKKKNEKEQYIHKGIEEHRKICKMLSTFSAEQLAAIGMMIEELNPGAYTRKDEIVITINTKEVTLDDYIKKMLPDVNLIKAKELYKSTRQKRTNL